MWHEAINDILLDLPVFGHLTFESLCPLTPTGIVLIKAVFCLGSYYSLKQAFLAQVKTNRHSLLSKSCSAFQDWDSILCPLSLSNSTIRINVLVTKLSWSFTYSSSCDNMNHILLELYLWIYLSSQLSVRTLRAKTMIYSVVQLLSPSLDLPLGSIVLL